MDVVRLCALGGAIILVVFGTGGARAQTDFTAGKTAAQLFASDCATCHRSPQGLARGRNPASIAYFLRDHYTTKPASAGAIAAYLASARATAPPTQPTAAPGQAPQPDPAAGAAPATATAPAVRQRPLERIANATVERLKMFATSADPAKPVDPNAPDRGAARLGAYAAAGAAVDLVRQTAVAAAMRAGGAIVTVRETPATPTPAVSPAQGEPAKDVAGSTTGAVAAPAKPEAPAAPGAGPTPQLRGPPASGARPSTQSNDDLL